MDGWFGGRSGGSLSGDQVTGQWSGWDVERLGAWAVGWGGLSRGMIEWVGD